MNMTKHVKVTVAAAIAISALVVSLILGCNQPSQRVDRLLNELADRPGGHIDFFWRGRSTEAIEADFDSLGVDALPGLVKALSDADPTIRYLAAGELGRLGDRRAVKPLIASTRDSNRIVQYWAVSALGDIGDSAAVDVLTPFLVHDDPGMRFRAAESLGQIGDGRAYEPLLKLLEDRELYPQAYAAGAIGRLGDSRARAVLQGIINSHADEWVKREAAESLRCLEQGDREEP